MEEPQPLPKGMKAEPAEYRQPEKVANINHGDTNILGLLRQKINSIEEFDAVFTECLVHEGADEYTEVKLSIKVVKPS